MSNRRRRIVKERSPPTNKALKTKAPTAPSVTRTNGKSPDQQPERVNELLLEHLAEPTIALAEMARVLTPGGKQRLTFIIPSRGLIGYHGEFMTDTRGTGMMNRLFLGYQPWAGPIEGRRNGSLISNSDGEAIQYALFYLQERGTLFGRGGRPALGDQPVDHAERDAIDQLLQRVGHRILACVKLPLHPMPRARCGSKRRNAAMPIRQPARPLNE